MKPTHPDGILVLILVLPHNPRLVLNRLLHLRLGFLRRFIRITTRRPSPGEWARCAARGGKCRRCLAQGALKRESGGGLHRSVHYDASRRASTRLLRERVWRQVILAVYVWDALNFQQHGAAGIARGAHNPEVLGSKPSAAIQSHYHSFCCVSMFQNTVPIYSHTPEPAQDHEYYDRQEH